MLKIMQSALFIIVTIFYAIIRPTASVYVFLIQIFTTSSFVREVSPIYSMFSVIGNLIGSYIAYKSYKRSKYGLFCLFIFPYLYTACMFVSSERTTAGAIDSLISSTFINLLLFASVYKRWQDFV